MWQLPDANGDGATWKTSCAGSASSHVSRRLADGCRTCEQRGTALRCRTGPHGRHSTPRVQPVACNVLGIAHCSRVAFGALSCGARRAAFPRYCHSGNRCESKALRCGARRRACARSRATGAIGASDRSSCLATPTMPRPCSPAPRHLRNRNVVPIRGHGPDPLRHGNLALQGTPNAVPNGQCLSAPEPYVRLFPVRRHVWMCVCARARARRVCGCPLLFCVRACTHASVRAHFAERRASEWYHRWGASRPSRPTSNPVYIRNQQCNNNGNINDNKNETTQFEQRV